VRSVGLGDDGIMPAVIDKLDFMFDKEAKFSVGIPAAIFYPIGANFIKAAKAVGISTGLMFDFSDRFG